MNMFRTMRGWMGLCSALALLTSGYAAGTRTQEQKFDVLRIGTRSYTNATVTSKATDYIFVLHSGGLETIRVGDLSLELKEELGYEVPKPKTNTVVNWTRAQVSKLNAEEVQELKENWRAHVPPAFRAPETIHPALLWAAVGVGFFAYLFFCYCGLLICRKAGYEPGLLIWLPVLQMIPLLRAADMSPVWLLAWLIPLLNIVAQIVWSFKIVGKRGKGVLTVLFLIFPFTSPLAFMYLAFSNGAVAKDERPRLPEIMTLETA
jgi:hypothetical protein